jgi:hypothetical protein
MSRDFFHTGLQLSRSQAQEIKAATNPFLKLYVNKGSGVAQPNKSIYRAGSDEHDGLSWDTAFATIAKAISTANAFINWSATPWAPNVEIHIFPGSYAESITSLPYGSSLIGYGSAWDADGQRGVRIKPASGAAVDVGACINCLIDNINFEVADASRVFDAAILNNVQIRNCRFAGPPEATTATAGIYTNDSVMLTFENNLIQYVDCGMDFVYVDGGDSMTRALIRHNVMTYMSEAGIRVSANLVTPANTIAFNIINGGGITLAVGVDDNSGNDILGVFGNQISATDAIQGVTTHVGGNYIGGSNIE